MITERAEPREGAIESFQGPYRFLSNFWPARVSLDGESYPSVEHAYQAAKTLDLEARASIRLAASPGFAKRMGRLLTIRPDWDDVRLGVMYQLVQQKFDGPLGRLLLETGDRELVEGNTWGDRFWGVCLGEGSNHMGKILMSVRAELAEKAGDMNHRLS